MTINPSKQVWAAFVFCILPAACGKSPPEEAIRANIAFMQEAVEKKDSGDCVKYLAEHFMGSHGLDKQGLRRILLAQFLRHQNINVAVTRLDIEVDAYNPLYAKMDAVLLLSGAQGLLPQDGRIVKVNGDWEFLDDEWLLVRAEWE